MILYHVSTDINMDGHFYPRIPHSIMAGEFESIYRICVAPSIADCFSAIPNGGSRLDELNEEQDGLYKVFRIDTEKIGIPDTHILTWQHLFEEDMVPDAEWTEEHWITTDFTVPEEDVFMIHLKNWNEKSCDIIPKRIYTIAEEDYEGDYFEAYADVMDEAVPCMSAIKDVLYQQEPYKKGDTIDMCLWSCEEEDIEKLINIAKTNFNVELVQQDNMDLLVIKGELTVEQYSVCSLGVKGVQGIYDIEGLTEKLVIERLLQVS